MARNALRSSNAEMAIPALMIGATGVAGATILANAMMVIPALSIDAITDVALIPLSNVAMERLA
jgi:hypothetical protein